MKLKTSLEMFIEITKRFSKLNLWRFTITSYAFMGETFAPSKEKKVPEGKREIQFKSERKFSFDFGFGSRGDSYQIYLDTLRKFNSQW
jgi:hypothetical protein